MCELILCWRDALRVSISGEVYASNLSSLTMLSHCRQQQLSSSDSGCSVFSEHRIEVRGDEQGNEVRD